MARHMTNMTVPCPRCGALAERTDVAQSPQGVLRVHESLRCSACGLAQEADGSELSDSAREAFYSSEGRWSTVLRDLGRRRTEILGALRNLVHATPAELKRMMDSQIPLVEGTLVEIERVTEMLAGAEVSTTCVLPPHAD
jgi:hypothetical protein